MKERRERGLPTTKIATVGGKKILRVRRPARSTDVDYGYIEEQILLHGGNPPDAPAAPVINDSITQSQIAVAWKIAGLVFALTVQGFGIWYTMDTRIQQISVDNIKRDAKIDIILQKIDQSTLQTQLGGDKQNQENKAYEARLSAIEQYQTNIWTDLHRIQEELDRKKK